MSDQEEHPSVFNSLWVRPEMASFHADGESQSTLDVKAMRRGTGSVNLRPILKDYA